MLWNTIHVQKKIVSDCVINDPTMIIFLAGLRKKTSTDNTTSFFCKFWVFNIEVLIVVW